MSTLREIVDQLKKRGAMDYSINSASKCCGCANEDVRIKINDETQEITFTVPDLHHPAGIFDAKQ